MPSIERILPRKQGTWLELFCSLGRLRLPLDKLPGEVRAGAEVTLEQWRALEQLSEYELLLDRALRVLGRREHFVAELRDKLSQPQLTARQREAVAAGNEAADKPKRARRETVDRVLAVCRERGYLDDARAAHYLISLLAARGTVGKRYVRGELLRRGCAPPLADATLAEHAGDFDDKAAVQALLAKKRRGFEGRAARMREKLQRKIDEQEAERLAAEAQAEEERPRIVVSDMHDKSVPAPKKPAPRKPRLDEVWLRRELRQRMGANVLGFLAVRGFTDDESRRAAMDMLQEILEG